MKKRFVLAAMLGMVLALGMVFTGCDTDGDDDTSIVGTWTGTYNPGSGPFSITLVIKADNTWEQTMAGASYTQMNRGTYTYSGNTFYATSLETSSDGGTTWTPDPAPQAVSGTLSGTTLTVSSNGTDITFTKQ
jgi:hypothetical protein